MTVPRLLASRLSIPRLHLAATRHPIHNNSESGFTLVEVLVSILMIAAFMTTALQALIAATALKVKAEEVSEATAWMQEDLENIRFEANRIGLTPSTPPQYTPNPTLCSNGYAQTLQTILSASPSEVQRTSSFGARQYILKRSLVSQVETLQITHQVFRDTNGNGVLDPNEFDDPQDAIRSLYSEVIPDVTYACS